MKTKMLSLVSLFLFAATALFAQAKSDTLEVKGNCGMCENRIEKAAKSVEGVTQVEWKKDTKMMVITYDSIITNVRKVQMAIAEVGHDTPMYKAKDEVYNELPDCCKYDRTEPK